ncbi:Uncharacterised protein [Vibrio cholerae]|nr:Uncharacterised protein [Vibrio cholerae]
MTRRSGVAIHKKYRYGSLSRSLIVYPYVLCFLPAKNLQS